MPTVAVAADRFFSEPELELAESASMHSDASSGSEPVPQPEEEEEEEEEQGGRGQTEEEEEVEEGVLVWSPSTSTLPQVLLPSLTMGDPEPQGEVSYCESRPGCSNPVWLGELTESRMGAMPVTEGRGFTSWLGLTAPPGCLDDTCTLVPRATGDRSKVNGQVSRPQGSEVRGRSLSERAGRLAAG